MKKLIATILLALSALPAFAYSECPTTISYIFYGTNSAPGAMFVYTTLGTTFIIEAANSNYSNYHGAASLALAFGSQIKVRYTANGVDCASGAARTDVEGIWQFP